MSREQLINWLSRLVQDGTLTEDEAAEILDAFDRDEELDLWGIPIPPPMAMDMPGEFDFVEYVAVLSVAYAASMRRGVRPVYPNSPNGMMDNFERNSRRMARLLAERRIDVAEWQRVMRRSITEYTVGQVVMGGRLQAMTPALQQRLQRELRVQFAYLSRFADEVALGRLSEAQVGARSVQYGGFGRGEFYRERESAEVGQFGMVVDYVSQDDPNTCVPCFEAESNGPYLPGNGPFPGQVCLGAGSCRCERVIRYDPSSYALLTRRS